MAVRRRKQKDMHALVGLLVKEGNVPGLIELLTDEDVDASACSMALDSLVEMNTVQAWDAIGEVLAVNETASVSFILDKLADLKVPGATRALGQCLGNPNVFIRSHAVRSLARQRNPVVAPHLLRASRDPEKSIARQARRALTRLVHEDSTILTEIRPATAEGIIEFMDLDWAMEFLSDAFPEHIRVLAARRIGAIGGAEATQCLASMVQAVDGTVAETCWQALETCRDIPDFVMLPLLVEPRAECKARAMKIYARIADELGADLLEGMVGDPHPEVRKAALEGVTRLKQVGAIPKLTAALRDPEESVRICAVKLLARIPDASPELAEAAASHKGEVRRLAITALANRNIIVDSLMPLYFEFLLKGAGCTDMSQVDYLDAIASICKCLAENRHPEGLLAFTSLARSPIRRLRRMAIEAIMLFDPEERADALHSLEESEDRDVLRNVAEGLHECRDPRAILPLIRVAMTFRGRPALRAKQALKEYEETGSIGFLVESLKSRWAAVRKYAAEQLKKLKDRASIPGLLEASHDEDVEVQLAVIEALGPFAGESTDVTKRMLGVVTYGDVSVRQAACEALGEARCKEAVPELIKALHNYFLRPRAEQALKLIGDRKGYLAIKRLERREKLFPKKPRDVVLRKKKAHH